MMGIRELHATMQQIAADMRMMLAILIDIRDRLPQVEPERGVSDEGAAWAMEADDDH